MAGKKLDKSNQKSMEKSGDVLEHEASEGEPEEGKPEEGMSPEEKLKEELKSPDMQNILERYGTLLFYHEPMIKELFFSLLYSINLELTINPAIEKSLCLGISVNNVFPGKIDKQLLNSSMLSLISPVDMSYSSAKLLKSNQQGSFHTVQEFITKGEILNRFEGTYHVIMGKIEVTAQIEPTFIQESFPDQELTFCVLKDKISEYQLYIAVPKRIYSILERISNPNILIIARIRKAAKLYTVYRPANARERKSDMYIETCAIFMDGTLYSRE